MSGDRLNNAVRRLVALSYPEEEKVCALVGTRGYDFARIRTPRGWRTKGKEHLVPEGRKCLEGHCFYVAFRLAQLRPEDYYYCEGYAHGLPHAWVGLKNIYGEKADEDWCIDLTWPFYTRKEGSRATHDKITYTGLKFEVEDVRQFLLNRNARLGEGSTGHAILQYPDEIQHLIKET